MRFGQDDLGRVLLGQRIGRVFPPREEVELEVQRRELVLEFGCLPGLHHHVEECALLALGGGFNSDELSGLDRIEGPGHDLLGLRWELRARLPELGNVEILKGARPQRRADANPRSVAEGQALGAVLSSRNSLLDFRIEVVISEPDLVVEERFRILPIMGDDARRRIRIEQAGIEHQNLDQRRKAHLASLEDDVQRPQIGEQLFLVRIEPKGNCFPGLVLDRVQVVQPPSAIRKTLLEQLSGCGGHQCTAGRSSLSGTIVRVRPSMRANNSARMLTVSSPGSISLGRIDATTLRY